MQLEEPLVYRTLENKFEEYLKDKANNQILFSGPFGSGKTTFLKTYFATKPNYNVFRIYPVNYVLHENSDIFEILKYDIILELINKNAFQVTDIDKLTKYVFSFSQNLDNAVGKMIQLFSGTGKSVVEVAEVMEKSLKKGQADFEDLRNPLLSVQAFLKTVKHFKKYTNNDYVTSVIQEKLAVLAKKEESENVLIVDDMDRIDPDHLFRIISIFSSHIDIETEANKFGFDKIIFVGDNENFRSMFLYKYGIVNNYNAYISKLCSKSPFNFDPDRELYAQIIKIISGIKFRFSETKNEITIYDKKTAATSRYYNYIICSLIRSGSLSLRELVKFQGTHKIHIDIGNHITELNDFIDSFSIFNLAILLNLTMPGSHIVALQKLIENPLPCERIIPNGGVNKGSLNSELSLAPLQFYLIEDSRNERNNGSTVNLRIGEQDISILYFKREREDRLAIRLVESGATEQKVIVLTIEALKKIQTYVV